MKEAYEVRNPSFADLNLEQQIEYGINDWCAEGADGHQYFGRTPEQAIAIRASFEPQWGGPKKKKPIDRRIDGYNPEFLGAKPAKAGEDY